MTIADDTPLRLDAAAKLAFPDGSITGGALRHQGTLGTLRIEKIAGKLFTTLADIRDMREACRVVPLRRSAPAAPDHAKPDFDRFRPAQAHAFVRLTELRAIAKRET